MKICRNFLKQSCNRGLQCKFSHDLAAFSEYQRRNGPCLHFARHNTCNYGLSCKFTHDPVILAQLNIERRNRDQEQTDSQSQASESSQLKPRAGRSPNKQHRRRGQRDRARVMNKEQEAACCSCLQVDPVSVLCQKCETCVCHACYDSLEVCPKLSCDATKAEFKPNEYLTNLFKASNGQEGQKEESIQEETAVQESQEPKTCDICYDRLDGEIPFTLTTCDDVYHRSCLADYVLSAINSNRFPLICPNSKCKQHLNRLDIQMLTSETEWDRFNRFYAKWTQTKITQTTDCPNPDCNFFFEMMPGDSYFICLKCQGEYCLKCKVEYHTDMTCGQYEMRHDIKFQEQQTLQLIKDRRFKRCPSCQMWVERISGCDHMTCRCGRGFLYR